jgi:hypothetical protein
MEMISLTDQLFLSELEASAVRDAIVEIVGRNQNGTFETLINAVLTHRLEWCASQNFLAGFILGRLLEVQEQIEQQKKPGVPHAR